MATSTSQTAFLTTVKSFTYRGNREEFSNAYHLDVVPPDSATWNALMAGVWALESAMFTSDVELEMVYGHNPGTPPLLVYEHDADPPGTGGPPGGYVPAASAHACPGDAAFWVRWATTQKTVLGKPIFLRNYFHGAYYENGADNLALAQKAAADALGTAWSGGILANGTTFHRAGPRGAVAQQHVTGSFITTRTLKSRGKRHQFDLNNPQTREWWLTRVPPTIQ